MVLLEITRNAAFLCSGTKRVMIPTDVSTLELRRVASRAKTVTRGWLANSSPANELMHFVSQLRNDCYYRKYGGNRGISFGDSVCKNSSHGKRIRLDHSVQTKSDYSSASGIGRACGRLFVTAQVVVGSSTSVEKTIHLMRPDFSFS